MKLSKLWNHYHQRELVVSTPINPPFPQTFGWRSHQGPAVFPGALAPLVALLLNLYAWIDIIAVVPTLMDLAYKSDARLGRLGGVTLDSGHGSSELTTNNHH